MHNEGLQDHYLCFDFKNSIVNKIHKILFHIPLSIIALNASITVGASVVLV